MTAPIRAGLIGASLDRGWAASAHIPALKALPDFTLAGVATTRLESAQAVAARHGIAHAFGDWRDLVRHPGIDLVIVTVKVGAHRDPVLAALEAGKHVFCEWPLALDTAGAEEMLTAARRAGTQHMVGLQGRVHPVLNHVRDLVQQGRIGRLLSCSLVSSLASWGPSLPQAEIYRADRRNGATGLTIPGGHSLDTLAACLGGFAALTALVATQHPETELAGTGQMVPVTSADQVLVQGLLHGGATASVHIKADMAVPLGVRLEINGSEGDFLLAGATAPGKDPVGLQRADLSLHWAKRGSKDYVMVETPPEYSRVPTAVPPGPPFYTAQLYARLAEAIRTGRPCGPDFADAAACHRLLDAVQSASDSGRRVTLGAA